MGSGEGAFELPQARRGFSAGRTQTNQDGSSQRRGAATKHEYDFTKGERGKFFRPDAKLRLPIYLDSDVEAYLPNALLTKA